MDLPSEAEVQQFLTGTRRNWGRWGADDQKGAINLITPQKRVQAASLVRNGRSVSLSRPFPVRPADNNRNPAQHFMRWNHGADGGVSTDYYGISYHGLATTHLDALCHMWGPDGMWNGRGPENVTHQGTKWGGIENWSEGITTRGVLLDVEKHRGTFVTLETPVHGWELEEIAREQGVSLQPGDALVVNCGRESYEKELGVYGADPARRAGLHASCLPFIRDNDVAVLVWDMLDHLPSGYSVSRGVHPALFSYGVALVDNAQLDRLAAACAEEGRYEFFFTMAPILVVGGTGSPLNPIAIF